MRAPATTAFPIAAPKRRSTAVPATIPWCCAPPAASPPSISAARRARTRPTATALRSPTSRTSMRRCCYRRKASRSSARPAANSSPAAPAPMSSTAAAAPTSSTPAAATILSRSTAPKPRSTAAPAPIRWCSQPPAASRRSTSRFPPGPTRPLATRSRSRISKTSMPRS